MVFCTVPYLFLLVELYGGTMRFMVQGEFAIKYNEKEKKNAFIISSSLKKANNDNNNFHFL